MSSEGGTRSSKKSLSTVDSDDEISVIAVIKKGTSGIPKRARYHYIRELPLTSIKSLKKSLQRGKDTRRNQERVSIPSIEDRSPKTSTTEKILHVVKDVDNKPRVIELSDVSSKMELRRQYEISEKSREEKEQSLKAEISSFSGSGQAEIIHKLPPGTVLIKQEPRTPRLEVQDDNPNLSPPNPPGINEPGNSANGSSTGTTTITTSTSSNNTSGSSSASSISSCGSGSSSHSFDSGSASPSVKVKRLHRAATKCRSRKKRIIDVVPRRNPKRCGTKKGTTMAEVEIPTTATISTTMTRPRQRQRLLAARRQERNDQGTTAVTGTNRRTKLTTMPYMNTRSVTRKLYTVGATYQAPTRKDETEWREWPVHGMHERPIFHPQVGLAAGYAGRVFWSTPDADGLNWTYREILDTPEAVEIVSVDPRPNRMSSAPSPIKTGVKPSEESFEICMHESLHSVLAYCAQVMDPKYRKMVVNKQRLDFEAGSQLASEFAPRKNMQKKYAAEMEPHDTRSTHLNLSQLEDSAISDETLMEMSSIYKKLLPIEERPSSREDSPPASAEGTLSPGHHYRSEKTDQGSLMAPKSTSETSEIARILSEYNESLKETSLSRPLSSSIPVTPRDSSSTMDCREGRDSERTEMHQSTSMTGRTLFSIGSGSFKANVPKLASETKLNADHWLQELLVDTSLLYCVATGVGQSDLTKYVDSLDAKRSLQWLRYRDGLDTFCSSQ